MVNVLCCLKVLVVLDKLKFIELVFFVSKILWREWVLSFLVILFERLLWINFCIVFFVFNSIVEFVLNELLWLFDVVSYGVLL